MWKRVGVGALILLGGCQREEPRCVDQGHDVTLTEPIEALGGASVDERLQEVPRRWRGAIEWQALDPSFGTLSPAPGKSEFELTFELREGAHLNELVTAGGAEGSRLDCQPSWVSAPVDLYLSSEDGGLLEHLTARLDVTRDDAQLSADFTGHEFAGTYEVNVEGDFDRSWTTLWVNFDGDTLYGYLTVNAEKEHGQSSEGAGTFAASFEATPEPAR